MPLPGLITVNYRGTGAIVTDMIANNVNFAFTGITAALPHHKAGTLRILATQGRTRAAALPDVPTTAEAGFPQFQSVTWFGLFAPQGTPAPVQQGIVAALREAGIFNAASSGTMLARAVYANIDKQAGDTLTITWTVTIGTAGA